MTLPRPGRPRARGARKRGTVTSACWKDVLEGSGDSLEVVEEPLLLPPLLLLLLLVVV